MSNSEPIQARCFRPLLIRPQAFGDERGWLYSWNRRSFEEAVDETVVFSQDNHSRSIKEFFEDGHSLRRNLKPRLYEPQSIDLRRRGRHPARIPTYGPGSVSNSVPSKSQLWIPEGFAHGFLTLSDVAEVQYKARGFWNKFVNGPSSGMIQISSPADRSAAGRRGEPLGQDAEAAGFKAAELAGDVFHEGAAH